MTVVGQAEEEQRSNGQYAIILSSMWKMFKSQENQCSKTFGLLHFFLSFIYFLSTIAIAFASMKTTNICVFWLFLIEACYVHLASTLLNEYKFKGGFYHYSFDRTGQCS